MSTMIHTLMISKHAQSEVNTTFNIFTVGKNLDILNMTLDSYVFLKTKIRRKVLNK